MKLFCLLFASLFVHINAMEMPANNSDPNQAQQVSVSPPDLIIKNEHVDKILIRYTRFDGTENNVNKQGGIVKKVVNLNEWLVRVIPRGSKTVIRNIGNVNVLKVEAYGAYKKMFNFAESPDYRLINIDLFWKYKGKPYNFRMVVKSGKLQGGNEPLVQTTSETLQSREWNGWSNMLWSIAATAYQKTSNASSSLYKGIEPRLAPFDIRAWAPEGPDVVKMVSEEHENLFPSILDHFPNAKERSEKKDIYGYRINKKIYGYHILDLPKDFEKYDKQKSIDEAKEHLNGTLKNKKEAYEKAGTEPLAIAIMRRIPEILEEAAEDPTSEFDNLLRKIN